MSQAVTIRKGLLSDLDAVLECVRAAYAPYVPRMNKRPASMDTDFAPLLRGGLVWVAEKDGRVVALIVVFEDGGEPEIRSVAVLPSMQRGGIGRALMNHAETMLRESGYSTVRLYTNVKIPELVVYYTGLGYEEVERRLDHGYDRVFMKKRLAH